MNKFIALAGTGLLLIGSTAYAQDVPTPSDAADPLPEAAADSADIATTPDADLPADSATTGELPADTAPAGPAAPADAATHQGHTGAPMTSAPATGEVAFTDEQIQGFAAAALKIQNLQGDDAAKQTQAVTIVAESGLDAETFNAIGQAMQSDPAVAERVQLAAGAMQAQPEG